MERKIGEIFNIDNEWHQVVKSNGECCNGCAFYEKGCKAKYADVGSCGTSRKDWTQVIFKKLEKVGKPTIIMGKMVQEFKNNNNNHCEYCCFNKDCHPLEIASICDLHNSFFVELKQNQENMEEKKDELEKITSAYVNGKITYGEYEEKIEKYYKSKYGKESTEENKLNLKPFDLEKAREGKPVCTRDGRKARIICFDAKGDKPIIALVEMGTAETPNNYPIDGKAVSAKEASCDLMMLPEKKEGWAIIRRSDIYETEEQAKKVILDSRIGVMIRKVEWEE